MKPFWQSKTIVFNVLAVVVFVATAFGYGDFMPDADIMAVAAAVLNLALRYITKEPIVLSR